MKDAVEYARMILAEIHSDMGSLRSSKGEVMPRDVASFSHLHDFCDANMYLIDAMRDDFELPEPDDCPWTDTVLHGPGSQTEGILPPEPYRYQEHTETCPAQMKRDLRDAMANRVSDMVDEQLRREAMAIWRDRGDLPGVIAIALAEHDTRPCKGYMVMTPFNEGDGITIIDVHEWGAPRGRHDWQVTVFNREHR